MRAGVGARGRLASALRALVLCACWLPLPVGVWGTWRVLEVAREIPAVPDIHAGGPAWGSAVVSREGVRVSGSQAQRAVAFERLPPRLVAAFLAAEDEDFFGHRALDLRAIGRAAVSNFRAGRTVQGGSTISQQVAKQAIGDERSYTRKVRELLLARRIEAVYPKREILRAYMEQVFLGHQAHGVTAASWLYFDRSPEALDLGQMATLAGLLPSPNRYDPIRHPEAARAQRDRVLRRMYDLGMISAEERARWQARPVEVARQRGESAPFVAESARRALKARFGEEAWGSGGYVVVMPQEPGEQARAQQAVREALVAHDRRQGWRGAPMRAVAGHEVALDEALRAQAEGSLAWARVVAVERERAVVQTRGGRATLAMEGVRWASGGGEDVRAVLRVGDVVRVVVGEGGELGLWQAPRMEGALLALDALSGELLASVGGFDGARDKFGRAELGCRQPGSVFKAVVYAEAIAQRHSPAERLGDLPGEVAPGDAEAWTPGSADGEFRGYMTLADALALSRNVPAVALYHRLGAEEIVQRARRMGLTSPLQKTPALALGASCVRPVEVARAYGAFVRGGAQAGEVPAIDHILTPQGDVVADAGGFASAHALLLARLDRMAALTAPKRAMEPAVAYIMRALLRRVVTRGTAARGVPEGWQIAGKTGTTDRYDAWFAGLDTQRVVVAWAGSDQNDQPLGAGEHGATVALPMFTRYYAPLALLGQDVWLADPPQGVELHAIDPRTGLLARGGGEVFPFITRTAPDAQTPALSTREADQIDALSHEF